MRGFASNVDLWASLHSRSSATLPPRSAYFLKCTDRLLMEPDAANLDKKALQGLQFIGRKP